MYRTKLIVLVASVLFLTSVAGGASLKATKPDPAHGAVGVTMPLLRWTKGDTAMFHDGNQGGGVHFDVNLRLAVVFAPQPSQALARPAVILLQNHRVLQRDHRFFVHATGR